VSDSSDIHRFDQTRRGKKETFSSFLHNFFLQGSFSTGFRRHFPQCVTYRETPDALVWVNFLRTFEPLIAICRLRRSHSPPPFSWNSTADTHTALDEGRLSHISVSPCLSSNKNLPVPFTGRCHVFSASRKQLMSDQQLVYTGTINLTCFPSPPPHRNSTCQNSESHYLFRFVVIICNFPRTWSIGFVCVPSPVCFP